MKHLKAYEKPLEFRPKTKVWGIYTSGGEPFGEVKWYGRWSQYAYHIDDLVFTKTCLRDLADFIEKHEKERVE